MYLESYAAAIAKRLDVRGLINVQFAVAGTTVYVIEVQPTRQSYGSFCRPKQLGCRLRRLRRV